MFRKARGNSAGYVAVAVVLAVLAAVLLSTVVACEGLGSAGESVTTTLTETTETAEASLWGSWEGTYTPLEAWDERGAVADPPVELGVPVSLLLDLHALSDATGDYGTLQAGGFGAGRVTAVFFDGRQMELSIISEMAGLEDYHTVITGTLENGVLSGEDSGDPNVPSGWVSTSGTLHLTRSTAPASTGSTAATADDGDSAGEGDDDAGEAAGAGGPEETAATETTVRGPVTFQVSEDDNNHTMGLHVGDRVHIELSPIPQDHVTEVSFWHEGADSVQPVGGSQGSTAAIGNIIRCWITFEAVAPGSDQIGATYLHTGGSVTHPWVLHVTVIE